MSINADEYVYAEELRRRARVVANTEVLGVLDAHSGCTIEQKLLAAIALSLRDIELALLNIDL